MNIYEYAVMHYGKTHQKQKALEELWELGEVLQKSLNGKPVDRVAIIDEVADVWVMVNQLAAIYGKEEVEERVEKKTKRLRQAILDDNERN